MWSNKKKVFIFPLVILTSFFFVGCSKNQLVEEMKASRNESQTIQSDVMEETIVSEEKEMEERKLWINEQVFTLRLENNKTV